MKVESTYGVDAAPTTAADRVYLEDVEMSFPRAYRRRTGLTPGRMGLKGTHGAKAPALVCTALLSTVTVLSAASYPPEDAVLQLCGFVPVYTATYTDPVDGATTDKAQVYTPAQLGGPSVTTWGYRYTEAGNVIIDKQRGCRASWEITFDGHEPWMLKVNGLATSPLPNVDGGSGGLPTGESYPADDPVIGGNSTISLVELGADTAFGALILSGSIKGDEVAPRSGMSGSTDGPARVVRRGGAPYVAQLVLEQVHVSDFDIESYRNARTALTLTIRSPEPATGVNTSQINGTFVITDYSTGDDDGTGIWTVDLESIYTESGSDGGGLQPAGDEFTYVVRTGA